MVKPFNDFFNSSIGSIGLVETPFGFHIIKVTDKQDGIRLATGLRLEASEATADKAFTQATKFEIEATEKILMLWQRDGTYSCSWN
jgi:peptidyl-prolyl cis-trans isomerase D